MPFTQERFEELLYQLLDKEVKEMINSGNDDNLNNPIDPMPTRPDDSFSSIAGLGEPPLRYCINMSLVDLYTGETCVSVSKSFVKEASTTAISEIVNNAFNCLTE